MKMETKISDILLDTLLRIEKCESEPGSSEWSPQINKCKTALLDFLTEQPPEPASCERLRDIINEALLNDLGAVGASAKRESAKRALKMLNSKGKNPFAILEIKDAWQKDPAYLACQEYRHRVLKKGVDLAPGDILLGGLNDMGFPVSPMQISRVDLHFAEMDKVVLLGNSLHAKDCFNQQIEKKRYYWVALLPMFRKRARELRTGDVLAYGSIAHVAGHPFKGWSLVIVTGVMAEGGGPFTNLFEPEDWVELKALRD